MSIKELFIAAKETKKKVKVKIWKEGKEIKEHIFVPFDFGPARKSNDKQDIFHFYDIDASSEQFYHTYTPKEIVYLEILEDSFDPLKLYKPDIDL